MNPNMATILSYLFLCIRMTLYEHCKITKYTLGYQITASALSLGDIVSVHQIRCSGNEKNISQCQLDFYTPLLSCDDRNVAGLECKGEIEILLILLLKCSNKHGNIIVTISILHQWGD